MEYWQIRSGAEVGWLTAFTRDDRTRSLQPKDLEPIGTPKEIPGGCDDLAKRVSLLCPEVSDNMGTKANAFIELRNLGRGLVYTIVQFYKIPIQK